MPTYKIGGKTCEYPEGATYREIADAFQAEYPERIALVRLNGKIRELMHQVEGDGELELLTLRDRAGHKAYVRTAIMLLIKAVRDELGIKDRTVLKVEFTIGSGYYCTLQGGIKLGGNLLKNVEDRMQREIEAGTKIEKKSFPIERAIDLFRRQGMSDKVSLFRYRRSSSINVYRMGDYCDYYYGYMLPDVSYLTAISLMPYKGGFLLVLPNRSEPEELPNFDERDNLYEQLKLNTHWGEMMGIETVGDLNDLIVRGETEQIILVQEALQ
ncbi:MAG: nucleoside kinase, partial [Lachnospiraceae bacterium]|nr:nucleoside kinase [Lachnospiraceae bacterium]